MPRKINLVRYQGETVTEKQGGGIFDVVIDTLFDTGKKVLPKVIEKGTVVAAEKIGNKTGELIADRLHNRFMKKAELQPMMGASEIIKTLQKLGSEGGKPENTKGNIELANAFDSILSLR